MGARLQPRSGAGPTRKNDSLTTREEGNELFEYKTTVNNRTQITLKEKDLVALEVNATTSNRFGVLVFDLGARRRRSYYVLTEEDYFTRVRGQDFRPLLHPKRRTGMDEGSQVQGVRPKHIQPRKLQRPRDDRDSQSDLPRARLHGGSALPSSKTVSGVRNKVPTERGMGRHLGPGATKDHHKAEE